VDGFEQQRIALIEGHSEALAEGIGVLKQISSDPATVSFLKRVGEEMKELARHVNLG